MIPQVDIIQSIKFNLISPSKIADQKSWKNVLAVLYWLSHFGVSLVLKYILSYKCQMKKSRSHIKKCTNILLLKCNHL